MTKITIIIPRGVSPRDVEYRAHPPIGAVSVLGEARAQGYKFSLVDAIGEAYVRKVNDPGYKEYEIEEISKVPYRKTGLSLDEIVQRVAEEKPDIIGISLLTVVDRTETKKLVQRLKQEFPKKPIVLGGKEATANCRKILGETEYPIENIDGVDYILLGECQPQIGSFLKYFEGKCSIEEVEGLAYVNLGKVVINPKKTKFDPNRYALPAFDLYPKIILKGRKQPLDVYSYVGNTHIGKSKMLLKTDNLVSLGVLFTSYGCPYRCTYCDNDGTFSRYSLENVKKNCRHIR